MSMKATDGVVSSSATLRATVDFPDPDPPAIPMMSGFSIFVSYAPLSWNALCPIVYRLEIAARAAGSINENENNCAFHPDRRSARVQRCQAGRQYGHRARAHCGAGGQSGLPRYDRLRGAKRTALSIGHCNWKHQDQFQHPDCADE